MVNRFSAVISTVQGYRFVMALRGLRNVGRGEDFVASFTGAEARSYLEYVIWHHSGTAALCALVATMMGLTAPEVREALQGALMHDVGKFLVPSDCLWKAGRLSVLERDTLARHTTAGADFLAQRGFSQGVVLAARHHHERWDGKGYPDGLKGEKIPLTARIVVATHLACRHLSGFFLSYMAEFWDNEWRVRIVSTCHSLFARRKAKERTPWPASLVRSFLRSYNQDDYTERTSICREVFGAFQGRLPRRIPAYGMPTLQEAGQTT